VKQTHSVFHEFGTKTGKIGKTNEETGMFSDSTDTNPESDMNLNTQWLDTHSGPIAMTLSNDKSEQSFRSRDELSHCLDSESVQRAD
jgi:hypothetical protein